MKTYVSIERMNEREYRRTDLSKCCTLENGEMGSLLGGFGESDTKGVDLCPITPIPCRRNGESVLMLSTPLSLESPESPTVKCLDSTSSDEVTGSCCEASPRTPEKGVFNPFAPGPEEMCLAPRGKKLVKESRRVVARRLDFDNVDESSSSSVDDKDLEISLEKMLYEIVYETILEAIILKQTEDFLAENGDLEMKGCSTPTSPLPLSGISDTCPGAPAKGIARKSVNVDPGLCRKLEF